jgi:hypothetical protein
VNEGLGLIVVITNHQNERLSMAAFA